MTQLPSALRQDTILEDISDDENPHELVLENYSDYPKNPYISSFQNNDKIIGMDNYENDYPEVDVIEIPVIKKVIFQFNKPVELKFS